MVTLSLMIEHWLAQHRAEGLYWLSDGLWRPADELHVCSRLPQDCVAAREKICASCGCRYPAPLDVHYLACSPRVWLRRRASGGDLDPRYYELVDADPTVYGCPRCALGNAEVRARRNEHG